MEIKPLFICPIFIQHCNFDLKSIQKECILKLKKDKGVIKSNVGGWQSNSLFNERNLIFSNLISNIEISALEFAKQLQIDTNLKVQSFWININKFKDYNQYHTHPKSIFSGVYYIKVPKNSGCIEFKNPNCLSIENNWDNIAKEPNPVNSYSYKINPVENQLLLFPSWLEHQVLPNLNHKKRISLSFNITKK